MTTELIYGTACGIYVLAALATSVTIARLARTPLAIVCGFGYFIATAFIRVDRIIHLDGLVITAGDFINTLAQTVFITGLLYAIWKERQLEPDVSSLNAEITAMNNKLTGYISLLEKRLNDEVLGDQAKKSSTSNPS